MSRSSVRCLLPCFIVPCLIVLLAALVSVKASAQFNGPPTASDRGASVSPTVDQASLYPSTPEQLLTPGDQISIHLFDEPDYTFAGRIALDGSVYLPLIGSTHLQGLTVAAAEQLIAQRLRDAGMYRDPQVSVGLTEGPNAVVTMTGELHSVLPVVNSRTLYTAIAAAGGLPASASRTVTVLRPGHAVPISVDIGNDPEHSAAGNIPLFPGDTVIVSRIGVVYVSGQFRSPGVVSMNNYGPLTLSQVSAQVGGPAWDAKYGATHIIRTVGDHRTVTTVNIKDVLYGKAPDPIMQPNDIVFLPPSPIKTPLANGSLGSILGVLSFALATFYTIR